MYSYRWVHFSRAVLFCQLHQQLFTHCLGNSWNFDSFVKRHTVLNLRHIISSKWYNVTVHCSALSSVHWLNDFVRCSQCFPLFCSLSKERCLKFVDIYCVYLVMLFSVHLTRLLTRNEKWRFVHGRTTCWWTGWTLTPMTSSLTLTFWPLPLVWRNTTPMASALLRPPSKSRSVGVLCRISCFIKATSKSRFMGVWCNRSWFIEVIRLVSVCRYFHYISVISLVFWRSSGLWVFFSHPSCFIKATRLTTCECFLSSVLFLYIEVIKLVKVCGCFFYHQFCFVKTTRLISCECFLSPVLFLLRPPG